MVYDGTKLVDKELPKAGTQKAGKISKIEEKTLLEAVGKDKVDKFENLEQNHPCIVVTCECDDGTKRSRMLTLPKDGFEIHPESNMGKWKKAYGGYPTTGQAVYLQATDKGWFDFNLP